MQGHSEPVAFLSWSPDDGLLLTCSDDTLRLFDVATGQLLHRFRCGWCERHAWGCMGRATRVQQ